jgi:hypothetical protein
LLLFGHQVEAGLIDLGNKLAQKIPASNFPIAVPGENVKEVVSVTVH